MNEYRQELKERKKNHLLRKLQHTKEQVDFYSNDYLGFARSKELHSEIEKEYDKLLPQKSGSTGSRLLSGNSEYAEALETKIARYHQVESALLFNNGYAANIGLISCLGKRTTTIISDELIHASMIDGIRMSHSKRIRFNHNDVKDLEIQLSKTNKTRIVLVESVYSMDGDIAPLKDILHVCKKYNAALIVDEAHAIGTQGELGEGLCSSLGIQNDVLATVVTFGKAMGTHGAAVLGKNWLKDYLINFSRPFIYSTAPSNHQLASVTCAYNRNHQSAELRNNLNTNIQYFKEMRGGVSHLEWKNSDTAIQSLIIPGNNAVIKAADKMKHNGIAILPIRSPTVPEGTERLRISLHAYNTKNEIDLFFDTIEIW